jgi:hypothetical protein
MEGLRALGVPDKDLYLTTGRLHGQHYGAKARETAALLVKLGGRFWLLPDWSSEVIEVNVEGAPVSEFSPVITYGVGSSWVHGRMMPMAGPDVAAASR